MKITVEFDNLEEFQKHMTVGNAILITDAGVTFKQNSPITPDKIEAGKKPAETAQEEPAEEETKDSAPFEEKPQEGPKITEEYRVEVRKALATLNKMQTGNPAKALIAETGFKRLTDVPLDMLPDLMKKAQEAMNNA